MEQGATQVRAQDRLWGGRRVPEHLVSPGPWADILVVMLVGAALYAIFEFAQHSTGSFHREWTPDLGLLSLVRCSLYSLTRGIVAYLISLIFTILYGYWAAKSPLSERILLPLLDIAQSIPVLAIMPGLVIALVSLFPRSNFGLELAAVLLIFSGQVWNMTFSFYHSLKAVPPEFREVGRIYRFGWWRRMTRIELPYAAVGLVWNSMMSMAGGWFFLTVIEDLTLGDQHYSLPGLGSYMQAAVKQGSTTNVLAAIAAMIVMIVMVDQLIWKPLVVWAQRFRIEETTGGKQPTSWFLDLLQWSRLLRIIGETVLAPCLTTIERAVEHPRPPAVAGTEPDGDAGGRPRFLPRVINVLAWVVLGTVAVWGAFKLAALVCQVRKPEWREIGVGLVLTFLRTAAAVILGSLWTIPVGIIIGTRPRLAASLQPVIQVAASFPAPMLFPLVILVFAHAGITLGWGSIVLLLLGTQWYILFNTVAGASTIPHDLREAAEIYRWDTLSRWRHLYLPSVFPYLVTGWVTAAGGAWNATIVAEYIESGTTKLWTRGLGSIITLAPVAHRPSGYPISGPNYPVLAAAVIVMATAVVLINRFVWRRFYHLAATRYSLSR